MEQKKSFSKIIQVALFIFSYQVGCGVFLLPSPLSGCGYYSLLILLFLGILCGALARVYSETGKNSQEIISEAFGRKTGNIFFIFYWVSYWFCTVIMFKELVGYLKCDPMTGVFIQIVVSILVITINLWSFRYSMIVEVFISVLKFTPFIGLVVCYFLTESAPVNTIDDMKASLFLRCLWCFIGLETGTIVAKNLNSTAEERKMGMKLGMISVIAFYILGIFFCFSICGTEVLHCNTAPYVTVFGCGLAKFLSNDTIIIAVKSIIVTCLLASINSNTLGNGYMAYEGAMAGVLPKIFTKRNKNNVPYMGLSITAAIILSIVLLSYNPNIYAGTLLFVDIACCFFFLVYAMCLLSYGKIYLKKCTKLIYYIIAFVFFCSFLYGIYSTLIVKSCK